MSSRFGRIVRTSHPRRPYTAIPTHDQRAETESSFATMREAEDFIRRNTPRPKPRGTFWDREAPGRLITAPRRSLLTTPC